MTPTDSTHDDDPVGQAMLESLSKTDLVQLRRYDRGVLALTALAAVASVAAPIFAAREHDLKYGIPIGVFWAVTAFGLYLRSQWGRVLGYVLAIFSLLGFPLFTILGIYFLLSLSRGGRLFGQERVTSKGIKAEVERRKISGA